MTDGWPEYDLLTHRARTTPERPALIDARNGAGVSYRDLDMAVDALAAALDGCGVSLGTRVGILLSTRPTYAKLVHAVARLGGVVVPLNGRKPATALQSQADRADVDLLVCGAETAETGGQLTDTVDAVFAIEDVNGLSPLPEASADSAPVPIARDVDSLAVIMFTSGTTGDPKGVRLTRRNLLASAETAAYRLGIEPDQRWLCCLPTYHMGGLAPVIRTALYGTTLIVQRSFDATETARVIDDQEVTGVSLVPTMLTRLLDAGWKSPSHLETVLLGGAAASESLLDRCREQDLPVYPTYGATEAASQIATATPAQAFEHSGTVGQPLVNTTVRIVDPEEGGPVERGTTGEIVVSGPAISSGYLDDDLTNAAYSKYGYHTGDQGSRDEAGRLWIHGRIDDRIVTGGETVDPETVAAAVSDHPDVKRVAVVGLDDDEWGERVAAMVVGDVSEETLIEHCRDRLADFEVPKTVEVAEALPRTASGTVDREAVGNRFSDPGQD